MVPDILCKQKLGRNSYWYFIKYLLYNSTKRRGQIIHRLINLCHLGGSCYKLISKICVYSKWKSPVKVKETIRHCVFEIQTAFFPWIGFSESCPLKGLGWLSRGWWADVESFDGGGRGFNLRKCSQIRRQAGFCGCMEAAEYPAGVRISQMKVAGCL